LQDKFIRASHFEPAMQVIAEKAGIDRADMPFALQEVIFSSAVQHGPNAASRIISRALGQVGETKLDPEKNTPDVLAKAQENLIRKIYQSRSGQFASSTKTVQAAVKSRLRQEMSMAISMLREERTAAIKA
jgi:lysozyme family protein